MQSATPNRIARLPKNDAGYHVPWFVAWVDGVPDFRLIRPAKVAEACKHGLCWICGGTLGSYKTFVIGPIGAINRVSPEPPSHTDCAVYAAENCPFLTNPERPRRTAGLPEGHQPAAGIPIGRNPGVTLLWTTNSYKLFRTGDGPHDVLMEVGDPIKAQWFHRGRAATRAEVLESIESGLPILRQYAEEEGVEAVNDLAAKVETAMGLLPV